MLRREASFGVLASLMLGSTALAQTPPSLPQFTATALPDQLGGLPTGSDRDGGSSAEANGVNYWIFDDTQVFSPGYDFVTNSLAATVDPAGPDGITLELNYGGSEPAQALPYSAGESDYNTQHAVPYGSAWTDENCPAKANCGSLYKLWPYSFVYDGKDKQFISSFTDFVATPTASGWTYTAAGTGLSTGTFDAENAWPVLTRPTQSTSSDPVLKTLLWPAGTQSFTDAAFIDGDYYYQYGDAGSGAQVFLARVQIRGAGHSFADLTNPASWQYYHGAGAWDNNPTELFSLFSGGNEGFPVFFDHYLGLWVTLYIPPLSQQVEMRVAKQPAGPWSDAVTAFNGVSIGGAINYAPHVHLHLAADKGQTVYLSYSSLGGGDVPFLEKIVFSR